MNTLDRVLYSATQAFLNILGRVPKPMRQAWADRLGSLAFALDRKHRRIATENLKTAFGRIKSSSEIQGIARRVFQNLFLMIFEIAWSQRLSEDQMAHHFTHSGRDELEKALAKGKGALCLVAHFGNWELLPIAAHMGRIPIRIVYRPLDTPFLDLWFRNNRARFGAQLIPVRRGAMRRIFKELRRGYPVAMLMDQNVDWYEGVFVDFFKRRACTNTGMALLALKTRAPVLPVFMIRTENGFHTIYGSELPLIQTGDPIKDLELNTEMYNRVIELAATKFPDQWFWVHQRWKTRPYQPWPREQQGN